MGWLEFAATVLVQLIALLGIIYKTNKDNRAKISEDIDTRFNTIEESVTNLRMVLDGHVNSDEAIYQKERRTRMLRFSDELRRGEKQSKDHFDDIIEDIDDYDKYCSSHPNYKNNKGHAAREIIIEHYRRGDFLT